MDLLHINIFYQYLADYLIEFNNTFAFPDPEAPDINILYGCSGIYGHFKLCSVLIPLI